MAHTVGASTAGPTVIAHLPLVTDRMIGFAHAATQAHGPGGVFGQTFSGVPYKVFAYDAGMQGAALGPFLVASAAVRGGRFLLVAAIAALLGKVAKPLLERAFPVLLFLYLTAFGIGLARVVESWT